MTKTIKLDDQVHKDLEVVLRKRETFSQAVARLIKFYRAITGVVWETGPYPADPPKPKG